MADQPRESANNVVVSSEPSAPKRRRKSRTRRVRGTGTVYLRGTTWIAERIIGRDKNGKRVRWFAQGKTAKAALEKLEQSLRNGDAAGAGRITVSEQVSACRSQRGPGESSETGACPAKRMSLRGSSALSRSPPSGAYL